MTRLGKIAWAWLGRANRLGTAWACWLVCFGLVWGFITRHRTNFWYRCLVYLSSCTGLAWAGLRSPTHKFGKLKSGVIALGWIIIIFALFLFNTCLPRTYRRAQRLSITRMVSLLFLLLSLFVWLLSCLLAFDSFGFEFRVFLLFTCMCTWLCRFYVYLVLETFQQKWVWRIAVEYSLCTKDGVVVVMLTAVIIQVKS